MTRDQWYHTDMPAEQILYVRSADTMRRMVLSDDALAADVYWIRALQHFGGQRLEEQAATSCCIRCWIMATSLDPRFNIAYRFGSLFLAEPPPGGPGRPDLAVALLQKGIKENPRKWHTTRTRASSTTSATRTMRRPRTGSGAAARSKARRGS